MENPYGRIKNDPKHTDISNKKLNCPPDIVKFPSLMKFFYRAKYALTMCVLSFGISGFAQSFTRVDTLLSIAQKEALRYKNEKARAEQWAQERGLPAKFQENGTGYEIQYIDEYNRPQYYKTDNASAAVTISTNKVYPGGSAGLSLTGTGIIVSEWDEGNVRSTHQEFDTRVTNVNTATNSAHSTHVAGTIMASGVVANARGMAYQASLRSYDWNSDVSEMASEGAAGRLISNHSYGYIRGWDDGTWYGNTSISNDEDYLFGFYDYQTRQWDVVAHNAPYFLICKSAGNDRGDSGTGHPPDGPYDCIGQQGVAKNILTVGAVNDISGGYTSPSDVVMSSFSCWGPADDGRIKPDIVTNGIGLYSPVSTGDASYSSYSGTSMACPSAAGSLALLQQYYHNLNGVHLLSATLKALVIDTADEAGPFDGPDYMFGWGLMNTYEAARLITQDATADAISERVLNEGQTFSFDVNASGSEPLKVTVVWNDPPGTVPAPSLDPITPMLVNDLDVRITYATTTYYPWKLDRDNPELAATQSTENNVDNVEVVTIASPVPGGTYTVTIDHDGSLNGGSQVYALIVSGILAEAPPQADFHALPTRTMTDLPVQFSDESLNVPTSWSWSFSPATVSYLNGTTQASQHPQVSFNEAGTYSVLLSATNAYGTDQTEKTAYITAFACNNPDFPYFHEFDNNGIIPDCWTLFDHQGNGQVWEFNNPGVRTINSTSSANGFAILDSDNYGSGNSQNCDLISPVFDFTNASNI